MPAGFPVTIRKAQTLPLPALTSLVSCHYYSSFPSKSTCAGIMHDQLQTHFITPRQPPIVKRMSTSPISNTFCACNKAAATPGNGCSQVHWPAVRAVLPVGSRTHDSRCL